MKTIKGYKFIKENMKSENGDHTWKVGTWYKHEGKIKLCKSGFHACKKPYESLQFIYGDKFFVVEARGKIISTNEKEPKFVASEMRLIKELPLKKISVKYACWCARQCLKNYEKLYPSDNRLSNAIQAAEDYIDGKINLFDLKQAESAARSAWSAAWSAAESAWSAAESARSAARSARSAWSAWSAAWSAAESAWSAAESARSAAESARSAARSTARSTARSAARSTARSAARSTAWSAARSAQHKQFDKIVKEYENAA